jgi:hypothetical protein
VAIGVDELPMLSGPLKAYRQEIGLPQIDMDLLIRALESAVRRDRCVILIWRAPDRCGGNIVGFAILSFGISVSNGGVDLTLEALWIDRAFRSLASVRSVWSDILVNGRGQGAVSLAGFVDMRLPRLAGLYRRLGCTETSYRLFVTRLAAHCKGP